MSAEEIRETVIEVWPQWQGAVINGVYPLRRMLHGSDHSAVFLTECKAPDISAAAIKIVPAERVTLAQLSHWRTAAGLSHPHLMRLLDAGLCQLGARQFLFVVMEYAEQTLAQVLPHRALTAEEVRDMLLPTLDALAFLHRKNLVQGQLKPANFLVVEDQLKLASDTVRPAGEPRASIAMSSLYDPPEAKDGGFSPAGDIWGLGITVAEALTQCLPWPDEHSGTTCLPPTLPPGFVETIQRCLSRDPAGRPTATELEAEFKPAPDVSVRAPDVSVRAPDVSVRAPDASVVEVPRAVVREAPPQAAAPQESTKRHSLVPTLVAPGFLLLVVALWGGMRMFHGHPDSPPAASSAAQTPSQPAAGAAHNPSALLPAPAQGSAATVNAKPTESKPPPARPVSSRPPERAAAPSADASPGVVHEQMPVVARSALRTIHGHLKVAVRVTVDPSGNVTEAHLENPGPSSYFARVAREAAGKWKFAAAEGQDPRAWLVRFEFTSGGTTGHATPR